MRLDKRKIVGLMRDRGIGSLGDLAESVGVAPQTLSGWLSGYFSPSFANLEKLCQILDCTADDILTYDRPKEMALAAM